MFDRFTDHARKVMGLARLEAQRFNHDFIGAAHVLLGLIQLDDSVAACVLRNLDVKPERIRRALTEQFDVSAPTVTLGQLPFTAAMKEVLEQSAQSAGELRHTYIGSEHLLIGLLRVVDTEAYGVLRDQGLTLEDVTEEVKELLGIDDPQPGGVLASVEKAKASLEALRDLKPGKSKTPALDAFSTDMIEEARTEPRPVVERLDPLATLSAVFARRDQPHALLIGDEGVGRDTLVHNLSQRLAVLPEPPRLRRLDLNLLVAGTRYRGQLEERVQAIGVEARRVGDVILYLPDVASFLSWPLPEGDDERPFRLFAPFLAQSELRCVGRIGRSDYRRLVARDPAVARLFEAIEVEPAEPKTVRCVLEVERWSLAKHYGVTIEDDAVKAAASAPACGGLAQPGAAVRLLDQACSVRRERDLAPLRLQVAQSRSAKDQAVAAQLFEVAVGYRQAQGRAQEALDAALAAPITVTAEDVEAVAARRAEVQASLRTPDEQRELESVFGADGSADDVEREGVLVLLPPGPQHARLFQEAIEPALTALGRRAVVLDDPYRLGGSLGPLHRDLQRCELVIADASGRDPGVACAIGLALGCGRRPLLLAHDPGDLPAGLRGLEPVRYDPLDPARLQEELTAALGARLVV